MKTTLLKLFAVFLFTAGFLASCTKETSQTGKQPAEGAKSKRVMVLGMIHSSHITSEKYSLPFLQRTIETIQPDYILTEIPPDRFDDAVTSFQETGKVTEPRVARFPEYVDVIFPLTREMDFEIIPTAAWTQPMAEYRSNALNKLARDETRADDWQAYTAALDAMNEKLKDREDDPFFIHTNSYDEIIKTGLTPYAELFANDLGTGDWEQINRAHYDLINSAIDKIISDNAKIGEEKTILITYGAAHKYWFLEQLNNRSDIQLVSPLPYLEAAATKTSE